MMTRWLVALALLFAGTSALSAQTITRIETDRTVRSIDAPCQPAFTGDGSHLSCGNQVWDLASGEMRTGNVSRLLRYELRVERNADVDRSLTAKRFQFTVPDREEVLTAPLPKSAVFKENRIHYLNYAYRPDLGQYHFLIIINALEMKREKNSSARPFIAVAGSIDIRSGKTTESWSRRLDVVIAGPGYDRFYSRIMKTDLLYGNGVWLFADHNNQHIVVPSQNPKAMPWVLGTLGTNGRWQSLPFAGAQGDEEVIGVSSDTVVYQQTKTLTWVDRASGAVRAQHKIEVPNHHVLMPGRASGTLFAPDMSKLLIGLFARGSPLDARTYYLIDTPLQRSPQAIALRNRAVESNAALIQSKYKEYSRLLATDVCAFLTGKWYAGLEHRRSSDPTAAADGVSFSARNTLTLSCTAGRRLQGSLHRSMMYGASSDDGYMVTKGTGGADLLGDETLGHGMAYDRIQFSFDPATLRKGTMPNLVFIRGRKRYTYELVAMNEVRITQKCTLGVVMTSSEALPRMVCEGDGAVYYKRENHRLPDY